MKVDLNWAEFPLEETSERAAAEPDECRHLHIYELAACLSRLAFSWQDNKQLLKGTFTQRLCWISSCRLLQRRAGRKSYSSAAGEGSAFVQRQRFVPL